MKVNLQANEIIDIMNPKIKSLLSQTSIENREDLEQELKILVIKSYKNLKINDIPNVIDLLHEYEYL